MEKFDAANPFGEFTKMLEQFKLPGFDVPAIMEARRKDVEALVTANQTAFQGMQSLAQKQGEMLRATLGELQALASSGGAPSPQAAELVQQTLHKALANMQQLAQAAYQSQAESYAVIQKRVEENVEELRTLMQQKK
ncbi:MAG: phasin family protein [Paraburkholderia sp.]|jgi:phasin family protein|uniref:Phasin family protein n=1 Tax=Paraburkholderia sartisoli TaxID=83784 RepID=A0A1H4HT35_9BURK|nr:MULTISPECIES: phasin family protein [Paraburkholderia]TAL93392.1 MAG: phasin family protein [Paraburkholderia sp.]SEB24222.1 phasin family protein [Paraburkholderia sartisoli]